MLSTQALKEFKEIFATELGVEISDEYAMEQAVNLLTLFDVAYRPIHKNWLDEI